MNPQQSIWQNIAEYARWSPSPHNTQPTRLKIIDEQTAEVYFKRERGLPTGDPLGRFTFATFGIFIEIIKIAAASLHYRIEINFDLQPLYQDEASLQRIATLHLIHDESIDDLDAALITQRRTSRLPYNNQPIPDNVMQMLTDEAKLFGHTISSRTDKQAVDWVIELNKDSLFYDLSHKHYREELRGWLRYSHKEAVTKKDGLSAEAMYLPGWLLHSFMYQHWLYTNPLTRDVAEHIYEKTMKGIATVAWIQGPYKTREDWVSAGRLMIRLWLIMTEQGYYWQPYGSIITNDEARQKMIHNFNITDERDGENMVWLLLRMGQSGEPVRSERLPLEEILL